MKKFYSLFVACISMIMLTGLASCTDEVASEDLVGSWESVSLTGWVKENGQIIDQYDGPSDETKIVFLSNGTYKSYDKFNNVWSEEVNGIYQVKGKKLILNEADGDFVDITIKKVTSSELTLEMSVKYYEGEIEYEEYDLSVFRKVAE